MARMILSVDTVKELEEIRRGETPVVEIPIEQVTVRCGALFVTRKIEQSTITGHAKSKKILITLSR